jgi:hypothetical protein
MAYSKKNGNNNSYLDKYQIRSQKYFEKLRNLRAVRKTRK